MIIKNYLSKNYFNLLVVLLLLVGILLRIYNLLEQSYWIDEIISANISNPNNEFNYVVFETLKGAPPLYQVLLWVCYSFFGFTELVGRLFSVFCGSLSLIFIFLLGKELFNKYVGLFALLIMSLNHFSIYYSQETRAYSLLLLLSIISSFFFVKFFYRNKKIFLIFYIISIVANFYTHYFGFLIFGFHLLFIMFNIKLISKLKLKYLLIAFFLIIFSTVPLMQNILELENIKSFWISKPKIYFWIYYFHSYFKSYFLDIIYGFLIIYSFKLYVNTSKFERNKFIFLFVWIIVSYVIPFLRSIFSTPLLTERNTIVVLPAIILLVALGLFSIKKDNVKMFFISIIISFSFIHLYTSNYYYKPKKQQWRSVIETVSKNNKKNFFVYDVVYKGHLYSTYNEMLNMKLKIKDKNELFKDVQSKKTNKYFWIIDAHEDNIGKLFFFKNHKFKIVKSYNYRNARAILVKCLN